MAKKENRPSWFKMFGHQKPLVDSIPDEAVGKAIKALFQYFDTGEIVKLPPLENALFSSLKPYVDESFEDFENKQRQMVYTRWKGTHPSGTAEEFEVYYADKVQAHEA